MDQDQELEKLNVDNDYEGGEWIGGEFYYRETKKKRTQTREDQLYGVFNEGDSDDDGGGRKRKSKGKSDGDYTHPVAFKSSGVTVNQPEEAAIATAAPKEEPEERSGLGSKPAGGLGFQSAGALPKDSSDHEDDDDGEGVLSTNLGARIKARVAERKLAETTVHKKEKQRTKAIAADPGFASFEKHTKGIGMKLMMSMGYKPGEGLGRDASGINKPIEAKLRQKGMALGYGTRHQEEDEMEKAREARLKAKGIDTDKAAASKQDQQKIPGQLWKKKHSEVRTKREYKTADAVVQDSIDKPQALASQPIIDMRGPQARVITNMEHLNAQAETIEGDKKPMPELQHNLQLLVDLCEAEIQRLDGRLRHEQDTATLLAREKERLEAEGEAQAAATERLYHITTEVSQCADGQAGDDSAPMSLAEVEVVFRSLKKSCREEYMMYSLPAAALACAMPRLQTMLHGWTPLSEPSRFVAECKAWRPLLESSNAQGPLGGAYGYGGDYSMFGDSYPGSSGRQHGTSGSEDPYLTLVSELLLPPLRTACTSHWQPRDPEPLISFLEAWEGVLPPVLVEHVLESLVMPKLRTAASEWEPRQERVPIHMWLHPWLPYLGCQLEELYPGIRHKLQVALQAWHPSDGSALALLRPWHKVFSAADWDMMLLKSIVPKLAFALQQLAIDPTAQDMKPFEWVMTWHEVLAVNQMVSLLEQGFFPQWQQVLRFWLSHSPDYDEVTRWYLGWKSHFPPQCLDHERIRRQFNAALDLMNSAVEGGVPAAGPNVAAAAGSRWAGSDTGVDENPAPASAPAHWAPAAAALTLKDLVERFAAENNVEFLPKFGRVHNGQQVYAFGSLSIVLDNTQNSVQAQIQDGRWAPVSLETLVKLNASKPGVKKSTPGAARM